MPTNTQLAKQIKELEEKVEALSSGGGESGEVLTKEDLGGVDAIVKMAEALSQEIAQLRMFLAFAVSRWCHCDICHGSAQTSYADEMAAAWTMAMTTAHEVEGKPLSDAIDSAPRVPRRKKAS